VWSTTGGYAGFRGAAPREVGVLAGVRIEDYTRLERGNDWVQVQGRLSAVMLVAGHRSDCVPCSTD
jgi:hypothetical protein